MVNPDTREPLGQIDRVAPVEEAGVSGRWVVIALLLFGVTLTGGMWVYWKLHLGPFLPLQKALADEFRHSAPQVIGGRHRNSPLILRVVLNVEFTPRRDSPEIRGMIDRIVALARRHLKLDEYELLEMHFVHPMPERLAERLTVELKVCNLPPAGKG